MRISLVLGWMALLVPGLVLGQEKSVRPGINDPFQNPDLKKFIGTFEGESREVYSQRKEILKACRLKPGMAVADVGAGTGLFTRLFAAEVGPTGKVFAVDIAPKFIEHIEKTCKEAGLKNVEGIVCKPDSAGLAPRSVDLAFICDTYHHFEFPHKTMRGIHEALKPGGRVVVIDFHKIPGKSSDWVMGHVRANQEEVVREIVAAGFKQVEEVPLLKDNYFLCFQAADAKDGARPLAAKGMEAIRVGPGGRGLVLAESGRTFRPWGFNYDHDEAGRLLEDYWEAEWPRVEADFREMKELGANVVRVHLQMGRFLRAADQPDAKSLEQLGRLLTLAEKIGLYLDLTGLGCYHKQDVPVWYDALDETGRWRAQVRFWEAVAGAARRSPAVFCYDIMNEPVVPGGKRKPGDWLGPAFAGKHFVQFITLDAGDRRRPEVAREWTRLLAAAIRGQDPHRLVTVGLVPWSLDRPGLTSGFEPAAIAPEVDFLCVHLYPESKRLGESLRTLEGFVVGKPVVIEETFPLKCSTAELEEFIHESRRLAAGWIGFYWGRTLEECRRSGTLSDAIMAQWLELFARQGKALANPSEGE